MIEQIKGIDEARSNFTIQTQLKVEESKIQLEVVHNNLITGIRQYEKRLRQQPKPIEWEVIKSFDMNKQNKVLRLNYDTGDQKKAFHMNLDK